MRISRRCLIGAASLWGRKYTFPGRHAVEDMLEEVKIGMQQARSPAPNMKEASNVLERGLQISRSAFGENGEATQFVRHALCLALFAGRRFGPCEKHLRTLLDGVDATSAVDRFELRVMLADVLRQLGRPLEAQQALKHEQDDSVEQSLELLARRAWLAREARAGQVPHELLNEAVLLMEAQMEKRTLPLAKYSAVILALQGLISLEASPPQWEQALERGQRGQQVIQQYRTTSGDSKALTAELGDLLTLQGRALLAGKNYLRAEETLDEALAQYGDDHARAAEAMLALGQLFRETHSDMYAEGMYRKILSVIARNPGEVNPENTREAYDKYAWFLRHAKRIPEAEEIEQEYIRFYHNKT